VDVGVVSETDRPSRAEQGGDGDERRSLRIFLVLSSLGASAIHFGVLAEHFDVYWVEGLFFAAAAWFQAIWGTFVFGGAASPRLLLSGAVVNTVVIGVWVASRTIGTPLGPEPGEPEPVAFIDALATTFEIVVVVGSVRLLRSGLRRERLAARRDRAEVVLFLCLVAPLTTAALISGFGHAHVGGPLRDPDEIRRAALADGRGRGTGEIRTLPLYGGFVETYVERLREGPNRVHLGFFDGAGREARMTSVDLLARAQGVPSPSVQYERLSKGHFIARLDLAPASWTFEVRGAAQRGPPLIAEFDQRIRAQPVASGDGGN